MIYHNLSLKTIFIIFLLPMIVLTHTTLGQNLNSLEQDLSEFPLSAIISDFQEKEVILLGEPTHGEGSFIEFNGHLVKKLVNEGQIYTIAFESGFYDLWKASQVRGDSGLYALALRKAIFPVWGASQSFQPLLDFLVEKRDSVKVLGFDFQMTPFTAEFLVDDLKCHLDTIGVEATIDFDYIQNSIEYLGYQSSLPIDYDHREFTKIISRLTALLTKDVSKSSAFWVQCLENLVSLARWYKDYDIAFKTEENFVAKDSNPRDSAMAENLLFWKDYYPDAKVIAWGAAPHFAYHTSNLDNAELQEFVPMGQRIKDKIGNKVFNFGAISGRGFYGYHFGSPVPIQLNDEGLLESQLRSDSLLFQFVDLNDFPDTLLTQAFEYTPVKGIWKNVFDQLIYIDSIAPNVLDTTVFDAVVNQPLLITHGRCRAYTSNAERGYTDIPAVKSILAPESVKGYLRDAKSVTGQKVAAKIIDAETDEVVPFATVRLKNIGTASEADGSFELNVPRSLRNDTLQISCIGYQTRQIPVSTLEGEVILTPKTETLSEVIILGEALDAKAIFKKALLSIPDNYRQESFNAHYLTNAKGELNDETIYSVNYQTISSLMKGYTPTGKSRPIAIFGRKKITKHEWVIPYDKTALDYNSTFLGDNYPRGAGDFEDIGQQPIFNSKNMGKFRFSLDSVLKTDEGHQVYAIGFKSKKLRFSITNKFYDKSFYGKVYISALDYAVVKTEMIWISDAEKLSRFAEKYYMKKGTFAFFFNLDYDNTTETCRYQKSAGGDYYLVENERQNLISGIDLRTNEPFVLSEKIASKLIEHDNKGEPISESDFRIPPSQGLEYVPTTKNKTKKKD